VAVPPDVVERIRVRRAAGHSLAEIARALNVSGTPTAHGGRQWWPSTVRTVLKRTREGDGYRASAASAHKEQALPA
jgi:hypothetical protein